MSHQLAEKYQQQLDEVLPPDQDSVFFPPEVHPLRQNEWSRGRSSEELAETVLETLTGRI